MHFGTILGYVIIVIVYMMTSQSPACLLREPERSVFLKKKVYIDMGLQN